MKILIQVSLGELYDKISILEIKLSNIFDTKKLVNISNEYKELSLVAEKYPIDDELYDQLKEINNELWSIEDKIRECEKNDSFDDYFISLARAIYKINDRRSDVKKEINIRYGSEVVEEKSYEKY